MNLIKTSQKNPMQMSQLTWIANFIWGIADDVLRDLYVRGKYRDVILPMTVLRRLDAVLEQRKQAVLDTKTLSTERVSFTRTLHFGRQPNRRSTTLPSSRCATYAIERVSSSSRPISRLISTASLPTSKKYSTTSSSAIRSRVCPRRTPLVRSSRNFSTR